LLGSKIAQEASALPLRANRWVGGALLVVFFALLIGLPLLASTVPSQALKEFDAFYRAGSLVFGGGHVVLPLLQAAVVPPGWVSNDAFLAGYGAAQAVPGPLSAFAAYLGTVMGPPPNGWLGAIVCLIAIFLPSFLLVIGALPFWDAVRHMPTAPTTTADSLNRSMISAVEAAALPSKKPVQVVLRVGSTSESTISGHRRRHD
jgi:chromate transporter